MSHYQILIRKSPKGWMWESISVMSSLGTLKETLTSLRPRDNLAQNKLQIFLNEYI